VSRALTEEEAEAIRRIVAASPRPSPETLARIYELFGVEPPVAGKHDAA
jgi:hypothetical protein